MAQIFVSPDFISVPKGRIGSDRCAWAVSGQITGFRMAELVFKIYQTEPLYQWFKVQFLINKNREFCEASREKS